MNNSRNVIIVAAVLGAAALFLFALSWIPVGRNAAAPAAKSPAASVPGAAVPTPPAAPTAAAKAPAAAPTAPAAAKAPAALPPGPGIPKLSVEAPVQSSATGLKFQDEVVGSGEAPKAGGSVVVHYTGYLDNGQVFDSSRTRGQPAEFPLNGVIAGFREGIGSMKVGGKRRLIIPPNLGYGERGTGGIPANSQLTFDVELISIK